MRIIAATALGLSFCFVASCQSAGDEQPTETPTIEDTTSGQEETPAAAQDQEPLEPGDPGYLDQEFERLSLAEQKRAFLVEQHIQTGRDRMSRLELDDAELEFARALELDSDNLEAKQLLDEVGALLGRPGGERATVMQQLEQEYLLKKDQAEADARDHIHKAEVMTARQDYSGAITELTLALDIVTLSPYSGEWQDIDSQARSMLESVRSEKQAAEARAREDAQREARDRLREQEVAAQSQRDQLVNNLLDEAIASFRAQEYDEAIQLSERVLRIDPRNDKAVDIRDTAFRKGRDLVQESFLKRKREQYARWQEEMEELRVPYNDVIILPDEDFWRDITAKRANRRGLDLSRTVTPGEIALRQQLADQRIPGLTIEDEESLTTVVEAIRVIAGLPIVVDPVADQAALDEGVVFDINLTNPLSVEKALNLIVQMGGPEVVWTVRHDAVLVTTKEKAHGDLVIYNHDVQDLIFGLTDFLGPRIDRLRLLDDLEDEDGGSPFGAIGEKPTINEPDDLATLVQENVSVGTWEDDGISITVEGGNMVVVHTAETQMAVRRFLEEMRRFSASLVTIESKFLTIQEGFLQEIGVDFRGLDNPGDPYTDLDDITFNQPPPSNFLDNLGDGETQVPPSAGAFYDDGQDGDFKGRTENIFDAALGSLLTNMGGLTAQWTYLDDIQISAILRAVEKSQNLELINDQVLSVHNTQRAYVTVVNQKAYVQDFDVEVAQFQAIADPVINVLTEGIVLDVRPTIHHDHRYLTLEVQPTVAKVVALTDFSTSLSGQTATVTFQLPELEVASVFTTAVVPDGGTILVGGLSRLRNVERRSEVPWLANIPLVGFFFKKEGYSDERESLMIMVRSWITDVKDELAAAEAR